MNANIEPKIFQCDSFAEFLKEALSWNRENRRPLTFSGLASSIKTVSPSMLSMMARGKRFPDQDLLKDLCDYFKLSREEHYYLSNLIARARARSKPKKDFYDVILKSLRPITAEQIHDANSRFLANWHYPAIYELASTAGFIAEPNWIQKKLKKKVSKLTIKKTIDDLITMGFFKIDSAGKVTKAVGTLMLDTLESTVTLRKFHKQVLSMAIDSIENTPIKQRLLMTNTMCVSQESFEKARDLMSEFMDRFDQILSKDKGHKVYQFSMSLFPLSK